MSLLRATLIDARASIVSGFSQIIPDFAEPPVARFPTNAFSVLWTETPADLGDGCKRSLLPSLTELILLNGGGAAAMKLLSLDCSGDTASSENFNVVPGGMSGFAVLGDSDDENQLVLPGQYNFNRESVGIFSRSTGASISEPVAVDPLTNAQMFAVGIESNARIWNAQSSGGSGERVLYTPETPGPELYENNTTTNGGSREPGTSIKIPDSDDVIFSDEFPAQDRIMRQSPDGSIVWSEFHGETGSSGAGATNFSQQMQIANGRIYYITRNPDGRTLGNGDYICSRLVSDGSDWQEHALPFDDSPLTGSSNLRCLRRDAAGDWWAVIQVTTTFDLVRYDSDFNLVHAWLDIDPGNSIFTGSSLDRFHDIQFLHSLNRVIVLSGTGTSRLRIWSVQLS